MIEMNKLKAERLRQEMTQRELAEEAGCTVRTIHNAETGRSVRRDTQRRVLKALGLEWADAPLFFRRPIR